MNTNILNQLKDICVSVGNRLGKGYTENIYHEAICTYLRSLSIQYAKEVVLQIDLPIDQVQVPIGFVRADITLPQHNIVIECKAVESELRDAHLPQILTYMKLLGYTQGIYVNYIQNPSKPITQLYFVQQIDHKFVFYSTLSPSPQKVLTLDINGNTLKDDFDFQKWVTDHITQDTHSFLSKADCKNAFQTKNQNDLRILVDTIEKVCGSKFKDKTISGTKYKGIIPGWQLKRP